MIATNVLKEVKDNLRKDISNAEKLDIVMNAIVKIINDEPHNAAEFAAKYVVEHADSRQLDTITRCGQELRKQFSLLKKYGAKFNEKIAFNIAVCKISQNSPLRII